MGDLYLKSTMLWVPLEHAGFISSLCSVLVISVAIPLVDVDSVDTVSSNDDETSATKGIFPETSIPSVALKAFVTVHSLEVDSTFWYVRVSFCCSVDMFTKLSVLRLSLLALGFSGTIYTVFTSFSLLSGFIKKIPMLSISFPAPP